MAADILLKYFISSNVGSKLVVGVVGACETLAGPSRKLAVFKVGTRAINAYVSVEGAFSPKAPIDITATEKNNFKLILTT